MADGTISFAEGLGSRAQDSNELRRKQMPNFQNPKSSIPFGMEASTALTSDTSHILSTPPGNSSSSLQSESGVFNLNSIKGVQSGSPNSGTTTKFQKPLLEEGLIRETEERVLHAHHLQREADYVSSSTGFGVHSPKLSKSTSPSRKLQQDFLEESMKLEAEERASLLHGNTLRSASIEVQNANPNPKLFYNARGNPYVEGDPNLGFPVEDIRPRKPHSNFILQDGVGSLPPLNTHTSQPHLTPTSQNQPNLKSQNQLPHTNQPYPKLNNGQNKPKPRNWASLLQSQSPSLDMKLGYFPDLQKGKEATVEIDVELTEVGKWTRYLIGHFLDRKMAYPLLVSTARNQWKDLFVAVKPDVSGFYLFEFKDEQAKMQVLEGGPYFFSQMYLVLKDWHRMMKPLLEQPTKISAWVKFHDLPLELWNQECLGRIASTVGRPIHVDQATTRTSKQPELLHTKTTKARVCIEISAEQELPDEVIVTVQGETVVVPIEYQVLPPMCTLCHVFGHNTSKYVKHSAATSTVLSVTEDLEWKVVNHGKQKLGKLPSLSLQDPPASVLPAVPQKDSDDSEADLLEVLEGVVSYVIPIHATNNHKQAENTPSKQCNKEEIKDAEAAWSDNQRPGGDVKDKPPDLLHHAVSDVKLLLGGSSKAGQNGKQRSHSKGSHKQRK